MVQAVTAQEHYAVRVSGGTVLIDGLVEDDPGVVALVQEADDPDRAVRACLQIGARASIVAGASLDSLEMEKAFGELVDGFGTTVGQAVAQIVGTAEGLVDNDDGPFPLMLRQLKGDLATQLDALFDPDSKSSALARMEKVFAEAASLHTKSMRAVLDPSDEKSPLGQWKAEVLGTVRDQVGLVLTQVTEMAAATAARGGTGKDLRPHCGQGPELRRGPPPRHSRAGGPPWGPGGTRRRPERGIRIQAR